MTLDELLEALRELPSSALTAFVVVHSEDDDAAIACVTYSNGRVVIKVDADDDWTRFRRGGP
jgi:hypothetical protein